MESIESTGITIQEAIDAGMKQLGVTNPSQVMVEVLQEPDLGIMGHGVRPAVVRLVFMGARSNNNDTPISIISKPMTPDEPFIISAPLPTAPAPTPKPQERFVPSPPKPREERRRPATPNNRRERDNDFRREREVEQDWDNEPDGEFVPAEQADADAQVGKIVLEELLAKMGLEDVQVKIYKALGNRNEEESQWILNITGRGVNRLIGRRGDTLSALQYIARLIISRRVEHRANVIIDAGGYKSQRSDRLSSLANRMADQALKQDKTVTLEPMPPHERRIIHLTLRKRTDVTTKSVGEGDNRRVTISPA